MSQPPFPSPPYPPPGPQYPYGASPYDVPAPPVAPYPYYGSGRNPLLSAARRASIVMWVMGAICLVCGTCVAVVGAALPSVSKPPDLVEALTKIESQLGVSPTTLFLAAGVVTFIVGIAYLAIGTLVRRGGVVSAIVGIVLAAVVGLYMLLNAIGGAMAGGILGACVCLLIAALNGMLIVWLIQSVRASGQASALAAQQAYQQQMYWQSHYYQQQQQAQQPPATPPPAG